ncbi:HD superfamily hydrolase [Lachnospiraceae bacterium TWA4]|nr:HD superfamily hydrolase [Lachnospiraceae bacterium TWA4]
MLVSKAIKKMIQFYDGSIHDINHFLKVWSYAKLIGELENIDKDVLETLELAAIAHDIACPLCRKKYGYAGGKMQEVEGVLLAREFYKEMEVSENQLDRICYLVGHHHTVKTIDGIDYQILIEADFLVNADESSLKTQAITKFRNLNFKTKTGIELLNTIYGLEMNE